MTLMTGTAVAQAIPIAISPILTRLFTPTDYGVFALYAALVAFLAAAATGRYELAVMLPESDEDADALVILSAIIAFGFGALLFVVALFARVPIASMLGHPEIAPWLLLLPVSVAAMGCYNALNYWLNRHRRYARMSRNRMLQSGLGSALQLSMGAAALGAVGLIVGQFIGVIITTVQIAVSFWRGFRRDGGRDIVSQMKRLARRYSNHPKHVLPAQWIGAAALQLPVLAVSGLYGAATVGLYAFAYRLMALPTTLIANAIGDVYRQRAAVAYRDHGDFRKLFLATLGTSAALAIVPVTVIFIIAPDLFALVFGEPWRVAGEYARILSVATFFQFAFTPIDKGALIVGATRYIMMWHVIRLASFGAVLAAAWAFHLEIKLTLILFVAANVAVYTLDGIVGYHLSSSHARDARGG
ncbi:oligosaccharide flippase family protein [Sphingopyxis terrae subsp. ummariensis]